MSELLSKTDIAPGELVKRGEFSSGLTSCMTLDEISEGDHITRRQRLPQDMRALLVDDDSSPADQLFAKDTTVVVTGKQGNEVWAAPLFRVDDEIVTGASQLHLLTPDGLITPEGGLPVETVGWGFTLEALAEGYFINVDQLAERERDEAAAMVRMPASRAASIGDRVLSQEMERSTRT